MSDNFAQFRDFAILNLTFDSRTQKQYLAGHHVATINTITIWHEQSNSMSRPFAHFHNINTLKHLNSTQTRQIHAKYPRSFAISSDPKRFSLPTFKQVNHHATVSRSFAISLFRKTSWFPHHISLTISSSVSVHCRFVISPVNNTLTQLSNTSRSREVSAQFRDFAVTNGWLNHFEH